MDAIEKVIPGCTNIGLDDPKPCNYEIDLLVYQAKGG
jgi:hypothetical protein